jgi:hypothetical protein
MTRDHVPPISFFPRPRTNKLITVPCCKSCNEAFGFDDEYVKTIIALRDDIRSHPEAMKMVESVFRALGRKEARGFQEYMSQSLKRAEIRSESGLFLGYRDIHTIDNDRLTAFVNRMARGLFFHVFGQRIPNDYIVTSAPFLEWNLETLKTLASLIEKNNIQEIGEGVFRFGWTEAPDSPMSSIWYMDFFKAVPFGAIIRDSNAPINNSVNTV